MFYSYMNCELNHASYLLKKISGFDTKGMIITRLFKLDLFRGLPKINFDKDNICETCVKKRTR